MSLSDANKESFKKEIQEGFLITQGNVLHTAELLGLGKTTIYEWLKEDESLEDFMLQCRHTIKLQYIDYAEMGLVELMKMVRDKPAIAFQSIKYFLETHAKKRGYGIQQSDITNAPNDQDIDYKILSMRQSHQIRLLEEKIANQSQTRSEPSGSDTQI